MTGAALAIAADEAPTLSTGEPPVLPAELLAPIGSTAALGPPSAEGGAGGGTARANGSAHGAPLPTAPLPAMAPPAGPPSPDWASGRDAPMAASPAAAVAAPPSASRAAQPEGAWGGGAAGAPAGTGTAPAAVVRDDPPSFYSVRRPAAPSRSLTWMVGGAALLCGLALGALGGWMLGGAGRTAAPAPSCTASTASARPTASAAPERAPSALERVAAGDPKAIEQLESKPVEQRTAAEALALARGRTEAKRAEMAALGKTLADNPDLAQDRQMLLRLRKQAKDPELAEQLLAIIAGLPGSGGPDLLYDVWYRTRKSSPIAQLAEELLFSQDVRAKASPALSVVLDLRLEQDCERVQQIVARAEEHGDLRCLIPLGRLVPKVGCGEGKSQDCYPCLGNRASVRDAISAVRRRPMPTF